MGLTREEMIAAGALAIAKVEFDDRLPADCTWDGLAYGQRESAEAVLIAAGVIEPEPPKETRQ